DSGMPLLARLDQILVDLGFNDYTGLHDSTLNMTLFTRSLMVGTAGLPHVIIRFFTVPKVSDARKSAGWALVFIALLYTVAPAVGAMARLNILTTIYPEGTRAQSLAYDERPDWMHTWEQTGLLKFEDKNGDGLIQSYNEGSTEFAAIAAERGWQGNEMVTFNQDILVLANPEIAGLPGWVIALIAAGGLAAALSTAAALLLATREMAGLPGWVIALIAAGGLASALSTAAGLLLASSSAVSYDLVKRTFKPDITERGELLAARISMAVAIVVATWLGMNPP